MLKNPIPKVSNQFQYRAIGIVNGKFIPNDVEQLNKGFLTDMKGEKIETVVLGKALSLLKNHIDLKKSYFWIVYPKNRILKTCIYRLRVYGTLINLMIFK